MVGFVKGSMGSQRDESAGPVSGIANPTAQMAKGALETPPRIPQTSRETVVQELQAAHTEVRLTGLGGMPENAYGVMAGFKAAATSVREKMAQKLTSETGEALLGGSHTVALGIPGKSALVFQHCISKQSPSI